MSQAIEVSPPQITCLAKPDGGRALNLPTNDFVSRIYLRAFKQCEKGVFLASIYLFNHIFVFIYPFTYFIFIASILANILPIYYRAVHMFDMDGSVPETGIPRPAGRSRHTLLGTSGVVLGLSVTKLI